VFQIAAHEDVIPVPELYRMCEVAYAITVEGLGVGRVIARPFVGEPGRFTRTGNRHDFAMPPTGPTLLDRLSAAGIPVVAVGKIGDLFAGRGVSRAMPRRPTRRWSTGGGGDGDRAAGARLRQPRGLRRRVRAPQQRRRLRGQPRTLRRAARALLPALGETDLLVITADHGNDPTTPSTDHSREYVPLLVAGAAVRPGPIDLGTRETFADLGQSLAALFGSSRCRTARAFSPCSSTARGPAVAAPTAGSRP
jgi:phosphopentomutase